MRSDRSNAIGRAAAKGLLDNTTVNGTSNSIRITGRILAKAAKSNSHVWMRSTGTVRCNSRTHFCPMIDLLLFTIRSALGGWRGVSKVTTGGVSEHYVERLGRLRAKEETSASTHDPHAQDRSG